MICQARQEKKFVRLKKSMKLNYLWVQKVVFQKMLVRKNLYDSEHGHKYKSECSIDTCVDPRKRTKYRRTSQYKILLTTWISMTKPDGEILFSLIFSYLFSWDSLVSRWLILVSFAIESVTGSLKIQSRFSPNVSFTFFTWNHSLVK